MKKLVLILVAVAGLITTADNSQAGLGWTLKQSIHCYGDPTSGPADDHYGRTFYRFQAVYLLFRGQVSRPRWRLRSVADRRVKNQARLFPVRSA
jgi:hypothetical protein